MSLLQQLIRYFNNSAFFLNTKIPRPGNGLVDYVQTDFKISLNPKWNLLLLPETKIPSQGHMKKT